MKRLVFSIAAVILSLGVAWMAAEVWLRVDKPVPRRVMVREAFVGPFTEVQGVPMWLEHVGLNEHETSVRLAEDAPCRHDPHAFRVLIEGDSILHGLVVPVEQTSGFVLAELLRQDAPGRNVCVVNHAQPGFSFGQINARALHDVAERAPNVLLFELWAVPRHPYRVADTIYQLTGDPRAPHWGNLLGLPEPLHTALLRTSAVYELVYNSTPDEPMATEVGLGAYHGERMEQLVRDVRAQQGEIIGLLPAYLDQSWAAQAGYEGHQRYETWMQAHGAVTHRFADLLADADPAAIKLDPVHLNAEGTQRLGRALRAVVEPAFQRWLSTAPPMGEVNP